MSDNVIYIDKFIKNEKQKDFHNKQSSYFGERLASIRQSLDKINKLMENLKQSRDKEPGRNY